MAETEREGEAEAAEVAGGETEVEVATVAVEAARTRRATDGLSPRRRAQAAWERARWARPFSLC